MSLKTLQIPRFHSATGKRDGGHFTVTGEAAGPFYIYRTPPFGQWWTLLHARTERAVRTSLPSRASARRLARALSMFRWDFVLSSSAYNQINGAPNGKDFSAFPRGLRRDMRKAAKIAREWERSK